MTCLEEVNHYINCIFFYYENMVYNKDKVKESYYTNENVDKVFEFEKWINSLSDEEIMYQCDYSKNVSAEDIRKGVKELIKNWVTNNCKGDLKCQNG